MQNEDEDEVVNQVSQRRQQEAQLINLVSGPHILRRL